MLGFDVQKCFTYCFVSFQSEISRNAWTFSQHEIPHKQTPTTVCNLVSTKACPVVRLH